MESERGGELPCRRSDSLLQRRPFRHQLRTLPSVKRHFKRRKVLAWLALMVVLVVGIKLVFRMVPDGAPDSAERVAVREVEVRLNVSGVKIDGSARAGNCVVVKVKTPNPGQDGPSVSLGRVNGKWVVRRVGNDFDPDSILGASDSAPCP